VGQLVGDSAARKLIAQLSGPGTLVDAYLATIAGTVGLIVSGDAISAVQLLRKGEAAPRSCSPPVSTLRWTVSQVRFALGGSAVLLEAPGCRRWPAAGRGCPAHSATRRAGITRATAPVVRG
jgi:putative exporter of polyketide antibiotics